MLFRARGIELQPLWILLLLSLQARMYQLEEQVHVLEAEVISLPDNTTSHVICGSFVTATEKCKTEEWGRFMCNDQLPMIDQKCFKKIENKKRHLILRAAGFFKNKLIPKEIERFFDWYNTTINQIDWYNISEKNQKDFETVDFGQTISNIYTYDVYMKVDVNAMKLEKNDYEEIDTNSKKMVDVLKEVESRANGAKKMVKLGLCFHDIVNVADLYACNKNTSNTARLAASSFTTYTANGTIISQNNISCKRNKFGLQTEIFMKIYFTFNPKYFFLCILILSMISSVFVLALYAFYEQLRNISGLNNMFLATFQLMSHICDTIRLFCISENTMLCPILGLVSHYAFTSFLFGVSMCSFHMFRVFWLYKPNTGLYFQRKCVFVYFTIHQLLVLVYLAMFSTQAMTLDDSSSDLLSFKSDNQNSMGASIKSTDHAYFLGYGGRNCCIKSIKFTQLNLCTRLGIGLFNVTLVILVWVKTVWKPILQSNTEANRKMVAFYFVVSS